MRHGGRDRSGRLFAFARSAGALRREDHAGHHPRFGTRFRNRRRDWPHHHPRLRHLCRKCTNVLRRDRFFRIRSRLVRPNLRSGHAHGLLPLCRERRSRPIQRRGRPILRHRIVGPAVCAQVERYAHGVGGRNGLPAPHGIREDRRYQPDRFGRRGTPPRRDGAQCRCGPRGTDREGWKRCSRRRNQSLCASAQRVVSGCRRSADGRSDADGPHGRRQKPVGVVRGHRAVAGEVLHRLARRRAGSSGPDAQRRCGRLGDRRRIETRHGRQ